MRLRHHREHDLLSQAGYTVDDIQNFETLKAVAEDITARTDELGFAAFTSAGMDGTSDWRFSGPPGQPAPLLSSIRDDGITSSPPPSRAPTSTTSSTIWDLYINNCHRQPRRSSTTATNDPSKAEFRRGQGRVLSERLLGVRQPLRRGQVRLDPDQTSP